MGEYVKVKRLGNVKLGTCNHLMYITKKEVEQLLGVNSVYNQLKHGFIYRWDNTNTIRSWEDISNCEPFQYKSFTVSNVDELEIEHNNTVQMTISSNNDFKSVANLPFCLYSNKAKDLGVKLINHYGFKFNIIGDKYSEQYPNGITILACSCCGTWFSINKKELDYIKTNAINGLDFIDKIKYHES
jgi:hypothetical protein